MVIFLFSCNTSYASLEFGPDELGMFLDDFMIKSQFPAVNGKVFHKKQRYMLMKQIDIEKDGKQLTEYDIATVNGNCTVDVDKNTNMIINMKMFFNSYGGGNRVINSMYSGWLPVMTSRYGQPAEEKGALLYNGEPVLAKYALFQEAGHYKYYFGGYRTPGPAAASKSGILIEITAL